MEEKQTLISQMLENAYQQGFTAGKENILARTWTRKDTLTTTALFIGPLLIVTLTLLLTL